MRLARRGEERGFPNSHKRGREGVSEQQRKRTSMNRKVREGGDKENERERRKKINEENRLKTDAHTLNNV